MELGFAFLSQVEIELTFLPTILVILLAASVGRLLSTKIDQPNIFGELVLGMIVGQFIIIAPGAQVPVSDVAEIGILLLLFSIGLDLDLDTFKQEAKPASGVAAGGIFLPFGLGYFAGVIFGFSNIVSLFIGASLVATSVGISASILQEKGKLRTEVGTLIMDSAVSDDVIGVIIMTVLFGFATAGSLQLMNLLFLLAGTIIFFLLSLTAGVVGMKRISEKISIERENLLLGGLVILLAFSLIAKKIGLASIIGAFLAGLVTGETHYSESLARSTSLIGEGFFVPIFFVSMGMEFNLDAFTSVGIFGIFLVVLAFVGKILGCGLGARLFGFSDKKSLATGVAMVPRAEVALIIGHFGLTNDIFGSDIVSAILVMVIITTLVTPPILSKLLSEF